MAARDPTPDATDPAKSGPSALGIAWALLVLGVGGFVVYSNLNPRETVDLGTPIAAQIELPPVETAATAAPPAAPVPTPREPPKPLPAPASPTPAAQPEAPRPPPAEQRPAPVAAPPPAPTPAPVADIPAPPSPARPQVQAQAQSSPPEVAPQAAGRAAPAPAPSVAVARPSLPALPPRDVTAPTWVRNARPFDPEERRPRIAIVIVDLGKSQAATNAAIQNLGGGITLAFTPYADGLAQWVALARAAGHEVLLSLPMEPTDFPNTDPGPQTLLTALTGRQNLERLTWTLERAQGYVGVINAQGSRFTASTDAMRPIIDRLHQRGLLMVDARTAANSVAMRIAEDVGLPRAYADRLIDQEASRPSIDRALADLERIARQNGSALGIAQTYPVTFERLINWLAQIEARGFVIAPVSAVVNRQPALAAAAAAPAAEGPPPPPPVRP
jgi:polysaccharide deacetylase 2 family uncharacterized protein YibQ